MGREQVKVLISRPTPELTLQLGVIDLDQGRPSVGAAVGHVTNEEVLEQLLQFLLVEGIVRFHGMSADGGGDHVLTEPQARHAVARGSDLVNDLVQKGFGIIAFQKDRKSVDLERVSSEGLGGKPQLSEGFQIPADEVEVAWRQVNHDGGKEPL